MLEDLLDCGRPGEIFEMAQRVIQRFVRRGCGRGSFIIYMLEVNINLQTLHGEPIGGKLPHSRRRIPSNRSARNKTNRWSNYQNCVELRNRDRSLGKNTYKLGPPQGGHIYAFGAVFRQPSCAKGPRYYNSCSATLHPMGEI